MSEEEETGPEVDLAPRTFIGLAGLLALPSLLLALSLWAVFQRAGLFRRVHQPLANVAVFTLVPAAPVAWWVHREARSLDGFTDALSVSFLAPVYLLLGLVGGFVLCWMGLWKLRREPWLRNDKKHWASRYRPQPTLAHAWHARRTVAALRSGSLYDDERAPLGLDESAGEPVFRYYQEANSHTLITGATGSGKSISMRNLIYNDLQAGVPVFVLDFKRDIELAEKLASWCDTMGLSFTHFIDTPGDKYRVKSNPAGPSYYDPLAGLSADAKADMLLNLRKWDTAANLYKSHMSAALTLIFGVLEEVEPHFTHKDLVHLRLHELGNLKRFEAVVQNPARLEELLTVLPKTSMRFIEFQAFVDNVKSTRNNDQRNAYEQLRVQIRNILQSGYGRWLAADKRHPGMDLYELSSTPGVVLFSISGDDAADFAQAFGSVIVQHITNISGWRQAQQAPGYLSVYIDEFAVLNPLTVKGLLQRGRSAGVCVTLALQSFQQVVSAAEQAGEALLLGYIDTVQNFIIHSGINYATAENMSNIFGKSWVTSYNVTHQSNSGWLSSNVGARQQQNVQQSSREEWILDPTDLTKVRGPRQAPDPLAAAPEAYFITKNSSGTKEGGSRAVKLRALVPAEVSTDSRDAAYSMDVGVAAGDYLAELKEEATEVVAGPVMEQAMAEGVGREYTGVLVEDAHEAQPRQDKTPTPEEAPEVECQHSQEEIDVARETLRRLVTAKPLTASARQRIKRLRDEYGHHPEVAEVILEAAVLQREIRKVTTREGASGHRDNSWPEPRYCAEPVALPTPPATQPNIPLPPESGWK